MALVTTFASAPLVGLWPSVKTDHPEERELA
jgi:hypothetical protein